MAPDAQSFDSLWVLTKLPILRLGVVPFSFLVFFYVFW